MQHHVYSAFGKLLKVEDENGADITDAPVLDPYFTFTGREYDKETGLYYFRARNYDSQMGRFMQEDPDPGDLSYPITVTNRYAYAGNNPVSNIDPTGESFWQTVGDIAVGIGIGVLAAMTGGAAGAAFSGWVVSTLGLTGIGAAITGLVAGALAGAAVGAVTGALIGGAWYEITGRSFEDGLKWGAVTGALSGGLAGASRGYHKAREVAGKTTTITTFTEVRVRDTPEEIIVKAIRKIIRSDFEYLSRHLDECIKFWNYWKGTGILPGFARCINVGNILGKFGY